jgi:hypothetical protein
MELCVRVLQALCMPVTSLNKGNALVFELLGVTKLDYMNPRITASPRRPAGGGAMP